uniref:Neuromedin Ba n=1 Tax=Nothobranchius furzeri TaxID=105023 RepID=A0A8C6NNB8_NOTFU
MTSVCTGRFLSSFILLSYIAMTSSMMLDLTELRNKISKLKVNPRGSLWATGHFMGKKSVEDSSFLESVIDNGNGAPEVSGVVRGEKNLQKLLIQMLDGAKERKGNRHRTCW